MTTGFALSAQAGPAMFDASYILYNFGNDITSGTVYPFNTPVLRAAPLGHNCRSPIPSTPNGASYPNYCSEYTMTMGAPATGAGYLSAAPGTAGSIAMPQSAFGVTTTGLLPVYYPYLQTQTFATFVNDQGTFFAGGGAAAGLGQVTKTGMAQTAGTWIIKEGKNGFGGAMGLLGVMGGRYKLAVVGKVGTYVGSAPVGPIPAIGRVQFATPTQYSAMGDATKWLNPHVMPIYAVNNYNGNQLTSISRVTGTPWTTGTVTVYALAGGFPTVFRRSGHDTVTSSGVRNIQLISPSLSHWISPGFQGHAGGISILTLQLVPEPGAFFLLAVGAGILTLLRRSCRRG